MHTYICMFVYVRVPQRNQTNRQYVCHYRYVFIYILLTSSVMSNMVTPWTIACQTSLSMKSSRQEYWSGVPFLLQGIFPAQRLIPHLVSPALSDGLFTTSTTWEVLFIYICICTYEREREREKERGMNGGIWGDLQ